MNTVSIARYLYPCFNCFFLLLFFFSKKRVALIIDSDWTEYTSSFFFKGMIEASKSGELDKVSSNPIVPVYSLCLSTSLSYIKFSTYLKKLCEYAACPHTAWYNPIS